MKIIETKSVLVLLLRYNEIPFLELSNKSVLKDIANHYSFNKSEVLTDIVNKQNSMVVFTNGFFRYEKEKRTIIQRLSIEERKIIIDINTNTDIATQFFNDFKNYIINYFSLQEHDGFLEPVIRSDESKIIASLEIKPDSFFTKGFSSIIEKDLKILTTSDLAHSIVNFTGIIFTVSYLPTDNFVDDFRIALSRKDFQIGAAIGYPLSEKMFFSKAPLKTDDHLDILQKIENSLSKK